MAVAAEATAKAPEPKHFWDNTEYINSDWLYLERDTKSLPTEGDEHYTSISLPHTWNAVDAITQNEYRRAGSWYRKHLNFTEEDLQKRLYLRFGAAGQEGEVYFNGEKLARHIGGYSAFTVEITEVAQSGDNVVDVWVSNIREKYTAPQTADFNFYGGLYRSVELIKAPQLSISRKHHGSSGVRVWSDEVSKESANLALRLQLDNALSKEQKVAIRATLRDTEGKVVSKGTEKFLVGAGSEREVEFELSDIKRPQLWSPESPTLYDLSVEISIRGKVIDRINLRHGFRFFEFTADNGFFLNGEKYKLHGVSRHQDFYMEGNALSYTRHYDDIMLMKEAGINWLRAGHYQQDDYIAALCDEYGILLWEEIPWVNLMPKTPEFADALQSMLKDMIEQHYNSPSIILWGFGNEVWMMDRGDGKATIYDLVVRLNDFIHAEDHTRKSIFVNSDNDRPLDWGVWEVPDVFGYNIYKGWYQQECKDLTARLEYIRSRMPGKPLIHSEFGAGSDIMVHSENPAMQDFSIEYQNYFLESHLEQLDKLDWLCGYNKWAFADFGSSKRGDTKPHVNQKGLVTFDRIRKDAFYIYKSRYSKENVVYIESPFWVDRVGDPLKKYRVFTNMDEVEFFVNGVSYGSQTSGFEWEVTLTEGNNTILAKGRKGDETQEHSYDVAYTNRVNNYTVTASVESEEHAASHAIDGDLSTYYSAPAPSELILDIKKISLVNGVKIAMHNPKKVTFMIEIYVSKNGEDWEKMYDGGINHRTKTESFIFPSQQEIRYIKFVGKGDKKGKAMHNSYCEITPIITLTKANKNLYEMVGAGE